MNAFSQLAQNKFSFSFQYSATFLTQTFFAEGTQPRWKVTGIPGGVWKGNVYSKGTLGDMDIL